MDLQEIRLIHDKYGRISFVQFTHNNFEPIVTAEHITTKIESRFVEDCRSKLESGQGEKCVFAPPNSKVQTRIPMDQPVGIRKGGMYNILIEVMDEGDLTTEFDKEDQKRTLGLDLCSEIEPKSK